jgi:hypothetical protein
MSKEVGVKVDLKQVERLGEEFEEASVAGLGQVAERGEQLVREEVPKVTHNLELGISSDVDPDAMQGFVIASARTGRQDAGKATLHLPGGKTKEIKTRAVEPFNYAQAVAEGTGVYGPKGAVIRPRKGKALIVPVQAAPTNEPYIVKDGQVFVVRRSIKGRKPDGYDQRAGARLEQEAPGIYDKVLESFAGGEQQ